MALNLVKRVGMWKSIFLSRNSSPHSAGMAKIWKTIQEIRSMFVFPKNAVNGPK